MQKYISLIINKNGCVSVKKMHFEIKIITIVLKTRLNCFSERLAQLIILILWSVKILNVYMKGINYWRAHFDC